MTKKLTTEELFFQDEIPAVLEKIQNRPNGRVRVFTDFGTTESLTEQQHKETVDVVNIVNKYNSTGEITHLARKEGVYADVSQIGDYRESLDKVMAAQAAFDTLPALARDKFKNDPAKLIEFMQDPNNLEEAVQIGLVDQSVLDEKIKNDLTKKNNTSKTESTKTDPPAPPKTSTPPKAE